MKLEPIHAALLQSPEVQSSSLLRDVCNANLSLQAVTGAKAPWIAYLAVEEGNYVGTCAFKSNPVNGQVEIAYFTFPGYENRGIAGWMAAQLVAMATAAGVTPTACTLPEENASTKLLTRLGFVRNGTQEDDEVGTVWAWILPATAPR
jgi:[ribosomal protein S5]-alanine N-acetyltransferase